jgi:transcriptional regulator of acetoin/glycerol metabolism
MPMALQTRLLRVLSEGEVLPLGGDAPQRVDLAVVAATHRGLSELVAAGRFREDLYYRLCGAVLKLPPLRERGDRRHLIDRLFAEEAAAMDSNARLSAEAIEALMAHRWPGNLRELRNVLRLALALCTGREVRMEDLRLPERVATTMPAMVDVPEDTAAESDRLLAALRQHRWRVAQAADALGLSRATVYRHMKRLGIVAPRRG